MEQRGFQLSSKPLEKLAWQADPQARCARYVGVVNEMLSVQGDQIVHLGGYGSRQDRGIFGVVDHLFTSCCLLKGGVARSLER